MNPQLTLEEKKLALALNIPDRILLFIRSHTDAPFEQLTQVTDDFEREPAQGLVIRVSFYDATTLIPDLRDTLVEHGYQVFYNGQSGPNEEVEIGILHSMDPYDILRIKQTNGLNYNLDTEDIIATLKSWEKIASFSILFASFNSVELLFHELPKNPAEFLEDEVRPFCYDFGTQAVMGEESMEEEFEKYKKLSLWWD